MVAVQLSMFLFCLLSTCFVDLNNQSHFLLFVNVFFYLRSFKRRRRDLNPRAAINDLLPFQGSPFGQLGYFSKLPYLLSSSDIYLCRSQRQVILYLVSFMLSSTFLTFLKSFYSVFDKRREWDSNPRALADKRFSRPPRYDHFDISPYVVDCVRCVLTADASDILASIPASVNNFFTFFSIFIFIFPDFP